MKATKENIPGYLSTFNKFRSFIKIHILMVIILN